MRKIGLLLSAFVTAAGFGQGWQLVERIDSKALMADAVSNPFEKPVINWTGARVQDSRLYYHEIATNYAYEGGSAIVLDDVLLNQSLDPSGVGRFRISQVDLGIYFPNPGFYTIQGFYAPATGDFPPEPIGEPQTFNGSNRGPHVLYVPQSGVWRLRTNTMSNVFTVQCGRVEDDYFSCYLGVQVTAPGAWATAQGDANLDYFVQWNGTQYDAYYFGAIHAGFFFSMYGAPDLPGTEIAGRLTLEGYQASYLGRQATVTIKQGATTENHTVTLAADGSYTLSTQINGAVLVSTKMGSGLRRTVGASLSGGTLNIDFPLVNGDSVDDNLIDDTDLSRILTRFGTNNVDADITGNGVVDDLDLAIVLSNFGKAGDSI